MRDANGNTTSFGNLQWIGIHAIHMRMNRVIPRANCTLNSPLICKRLFPAKRYMIDLCA